MLTVFGIRQCSTMKKTFDWLESHNVPFSFHDYKKAGIDRAILRAWVAKVGWEPLVNTRGTTWRNLPSEEKVELNEESAVNLMHAHPSLIKRPVLDNGKTLLVGFNEQDLSHFIGPQA